MFCNIIGNIKIIQCNNNLKITLQTNQKAGVKGKIVKQNKLKEIDISIIKLTYTLEKSRGTTIQITDIKCLW